MQHGMDLAGNVAAVARRGETRNGEYGGDTGVVLLEGWLKRRLPGGATQDVIAVLCRNQVLWFLAAQHEPQGAVALNPGTKAGRAHDAFPGSSAAFELFHAKKQRSAAVFIARSQGERDRWVAAIQRAVDGDAAPERRSQGQQARSPLRRSRSASMPEQERVPELIFPVLMVNKLNVRKRRTLVVDTVHRTISRRTTVAPLGGGGGGEMDDLSSPVWPYIFALRQL